MSRLEDVSVESLQRALEEVEGKTPARRLLAALAYKHGATQTEIAEWNGVGRKTVYNWLSRFEERPADPADAARDAERPGRPRKLDEEERARLGRMLDGPPTAEGYESESWTPTLLRRHIRSEFGVDYSVGSCRRLMRELGDD